ncbi:MAG: hypothetical protein KatS3mg028_1545 [Bacteroidia bacterium]|nr:MAG: hypothetical protein KatS3mg028_0881 [Bacteroidia bacterium]GIV29828.1 MAG: hypothetical protein KatS3mg028_0894 [Bacteroidia bacterium]GIV30275.1 MAG: hypothetical protein KatS3mg028_1341 [Bacteroidia bacterium]GIV30479.1 MAG: hypothetical protein KatS3mg028_1545 [Bacteroidia bacterium]
MEDPEEAIHAWYEKTWLVVLLCIVFFPVGLYALWKNSSIAKGWKIGVTIFFAIVVLAQLGKEGGSGSISSNSNFESSENDNKPSYAKIGDEVTIGHFVYRVNGVQFVKSIGNDFLRKTSDGIYVVVDLSLKNLDKKEHTLDNSLFKLTDDSGTEFESSVEGTTALEMAGHETLFLKQCNPKITKRGLLCFEVPETGVYDLHLSGGFWSGKTTVVKLTDQ